MTDRAGHSFPGRLGTVINRGTILFASGLGLTIREALTKGPERPSLYVLFAGMMGLPLVWQAQQQKEAQRIQNEEREKRARARGDEDSGPTPRWRP